jgi:hypothetical protein
MFINNNMAEKSMVEFDAEVQGITEINDIQLDQIR